MFLRGGRSMLVLCVVSVAIALPAGPAPAAPAVVQDGSYSDPQYARSTTFEIEGRIIVAGVEHLGETPSEEQAYAVATSEGAVVPIAVTQELPASGQFSGELVVEGELARSLKDEGLLPAAGQTIDADSAAGAAALATADEQATPVPVAEATIAEPPETSQTVTASAHRAYVVKMTDQGSVEGTTPELEARIDQMLAYWTTESDGAITSFTRQGQILDYDSAGNVPTSDGCGIKDPFTVWDDAESLFPGVDMYGPGNHLIVLMGDECGTSGPIGVATIGESLASGGPSILTVDPYTFDSTGAHELGHNFGLQHANLDTCPSAGICEYYDLYSPMALSLSGVTFAPPALGTLYRQELGLTTAGEVTSISLPNGQGTSTATYELAGRSTSTGRRGLLVTDPSTGTTYSVDWRNHAARDANTFYGSDYAFNNTAYPAYPAGVVVERQSAGGGRPGATYLMTHPVGGRAQGAFLAGETFSPTGGLRVAVNGIGSTASVTVTLTGTPLQSATPTISGTVAVGQTVTAIPGSWTDETRFTYDWKIDGVSTGTTTQTFMAPGTAAGTSLTVDVTGSKPGYAPVTKASAATTVAKGTFSAATPTYSGAATVGETLTAVPGTWSPSATFAYAWVVGGETVGTAQTFTVPVSADGRQLTLGVTGSAAGYDDLAVDSAAVTVGPGLLTSAAPTLSATPTVGRSVTAVTAGWAADTTFTYDWKVGGVSTGVATASYDVPASAAGQQLTVEVTGSKTGYTPVARVSSGSTVLKGTFVTAPAPTISGTIVVGQTVTAVPGVWSPVAGFTYGWKVNRAPVGTGAMLVVPASAVGETLTVSVTGSADGYDDLTTTSAGEIVAPGTLTAAAPTLSAAPRVGERVSAVLAGWSADTSFTYDWKIDGVSTGVTAAFFDVPAAAAGTSLTVEVTGSKPGYTTSQGVSSAPVTVASGTLSAGIPSISGTPVVGGTLTAIEGAWTPGTALTFTWFSGSSVIGTGRSVVVPASAVGGVIRLVVNGSRTGYAPQGASTPSGAVAPGTLGSAVPRISGTAKIGKKLKASTGTWTPAPSLTFQWLAGGTAIKGATGATFKVTTRQKGKKISVRVTGSQPGYSTVTTTSKATKKVPKKK